MIFDDACLGSLSLFRNTTQKVVDNHNFVCDNSGLNVPYISTFSDGWLEGERLATSVPT